MLRISETEYVAIKAASKANKNKRVAINANDCINCGKCKSVCPIINENKIYGHLLCGSGFCKDVNMKIAGSSGGLFGLFSRTVIKKGGVVYAAVL